MMKYSEQGLYEILLQMGGLNSGIIWLTGVTLNTRSESLLCPLCEHRTLLFKHENSLLPTDLRLQTYSLSSLGC